ncbi:MAG: GNAT family N-acetyltransferase [Candidatus Eremiobacteraeota bacterium]|nr:GNAT family N-acetyltransferase [Candidatus Eremiobacteraeota bacterium]
MSESENDRDCDKILADPNRLGVFVAHVEGQAQGFLEVGLRDYADGCDSSPVGYIEGWYVEPAIRRSGVGRQLVEAAESWARSKGCSEMASDALIENVDSQLAHARLGYAEVERQVCFRKSFI